MAANTHDLRPAEEAMDEATKSVAEIFQRHGLQARGVMVNVVCTESQTDWAFSATAREVPDEVRIMLAESLRTSAEEVEEKL